MFRQGKISLGILSVVAVFAIVAIALISANEGFSMSSEDGDLTGQAYYQMGKFTQEGKIIKASPKVSLLKERAAAKKTKKESTLRTVQIQRKGDLLSANSQQQEMFNGACNFPEELLNQCEEGIPVFEGDMVRMVYYDPESITCCEYWQGQLYGDCDSTREEVVDTCIERVQSQQSDSEEPQSDFAEDCIAVGNNFEDICGGQES